ncbi:MAG TPA: ComEC/Rec2 family competence protein, partial [Gaiellaceae bacterium]|nr:ComEC/Rec2 family competence protein [Gaiellaceae bacterium]
VKRVHAAHVVAAAAVCGLCFSDLTRLELAGVWLLALAAVLALAAAPPAAELAVGALIVFVAGWWWGSARLDALDRSPLLAEVGRAARVAAVITAEPRVGTFEQRVFARVRRFGTRRVDEPVQLELPLGRAPPQGARVSLLAVVRLPRGASHGFDERIWLRRQGVHVVLKVDEWTATGRRGGVGGAGDRVRAWLRRASAPGLAGERRALVEGVLLGDDKGLTPGLKDAFRRSGLYHLLAVSGQNVVLLAGGVLGLALLLGVSRAWAHLGALAAIGAYVLAVGPQPSVIRAAVSGAAVSVAWLAGRERDSWHVLLLAAVVLLAWNPYTLFDAGFQLSFAAVIAIFLAVGPLVGLLEGYPLSPRLGGIVAVSAACSVATAPILWLQFGAVPLLGILANALVELAVGPLLALAFAAAAVDPIAPPLAAGLAWLNGWVAAYIALCARLVSAVPVAQARGPGAALAAAGSLAVAAYACRRWRTSSNRPT